MVCSFPASGSHGQIRYVVHHTILAEILIWSYRGWRIESLNS